MNQIKRIHDEALRDLREVRSKPCTTFKNNIISERTNGRLRFQFGFRL